MERPSLNQPWPPLLLALALLTAFAEAWSPCGVAVASRNRPGQHNSCRGLPAAGRGVWRRCARVGALAGLRGVGAAAADIANKIDGKAIAEGVKEEVRLQVLALKDECGQAPCLAVVIIGERKDSQVADSLLNAWPYSSP